jgi:hypothetical protein
VWGLRLREPAPDGGLVFEAAELLRHWRDIVGQASRRESPAQLDPPSSFAAALANVMRATPDSILTDDPAMIPRLGVNLAAADAIARHIRLLEAGPGGCLVKTLDRSGL